MATFKYVHNTRALKVENEVIPGFIEAVFMTGPMTRGRYGAKPDPRILQILAQALIMYEIWGSSSDISVSPV